MERDGGGWRTEDGNTCTQRCTPNGTISTKAFLYYRGPWEASKAVVVEKASPETRRVGR